MQGFGERLHTVQYLQGFGENSKLYCNHVQPAKYLSGGDRRLRTVQYVQGVSERLHTVTMSTRSVFM